MVRARVSPLAPLGDRTKGGSMAPRTPIMKKPAYPLLRPPIGWAPAFGQPHPVRDLETWGSVARDLYNRDGGNSDTSYYDHDEQARYLMDFNFGTKDPAYVNWYLFHYVGCRQPSHDGYNWKFSSKDKPGIIYVWPPFKIYARGFAEIAVPNRLAKALEDAEYDHPITEDIHLTLDIAEFLHIGLSIAEIELAGAGGIAVEISGPAIGLALTGMALGMGHLDAIDKIKTKKARSGISHGVVLGAAAELWQFVKTNFVDPSVDHNVDYPDQQKNFQATYLWGLTHGYAYGAQLNSHDRYLFFKHFNSRSGYRPPGHFYLTRGARSEGDRKDYYEDCAGEFLKETALGE